MWKLIAVPVIGAIIGYVTNWIAVKMLFRPRYEKQLFGMTLPFTPGVIPKGKKRLAKAVGSAIEGELLTKEVLEDVLLSDETIDKLTHAVDAYMNELKESEDSISDVAMRNMDEKEYLDFLDQVEVKVADYAHSEILAWNPGEFLATKLIEIVKEKTKDTFIGMMLSGSLVDTIGEYVKTGINEYLIDEGRALVYGVVLEQSNKVKNMQLKDLVTLAEENHVDVSAIVVKVYRYLITEKLADIFAAINISGIVEKRIDEMEIEDLEKLILSIMKKELGAIVNLGALIGFILGLVNVAILCV